MWGVINKFREANGRPPIQYCDALVSDYCKMHCLAMAREGRIFHAPDCYLGVWQEAICNIGYDNFWKDKAIFDVLGSSAEHADILLNCNIIALSYYIENWRVYICIRGR
jgi:hypothetical protein